MLWFGTWADHQGGAFLHAGWSWGKSKSSFLELPASGQDDSSWQTRGKWPQRPRTLLSLAEQQLPWVDSSLTRSSCTQTELWPRLSSACFCLPAHPLCFLNLARCLPPIPHPQIPLKAGRFLMRGEPWIGRWLHPCLFLTWQGRPFQSWHLVPSSLSPPPGLGDRRRLWLWMSQAWGRSPPNSQVTPAWSPRLEKTERKGENPHTL